MDLLVAHQGVVVITEGKIFLEQFLIVLTLHLLEMVIEREYSTIILEDHLVVAIEGTMEEIEFQATVEDQIEDNQVVIEVTVIEDHQEAPEDPTIMEAEQDPEVNLCHSKLILLVMTSLHIKNMLILQVHKQLQKKLIMNTLTFTRIPNESQQ